VPINPKLLSKREVRRTLIGCVLLVLATAAAVVLVGRHERGRGTAELAARLGAQAEAGAELLNGDIAQLRRQVRFLASVPPVWGLARADGGPMDVAENTSAERLKGRLATIFEAFAVANPDIFQVRLIAMVDGGRELVRVDRRDGLVHVIPGSRLQRKGDTDYMRQAARLPAGGVYVSAIDLNREHGQVESPHVPTLRVATPLIHQGRLFGVVVLNYHASALLKQLGGDLPDGLRAYLVNGDGDFLLHPEPQRAFGFDLGRRWRWRDEFGAPAEGAAMRSFGASLLHAVQRPAALEDGHPERDLHYIAAAPDSLVDQAVRRAQLNALVAMLAGAASVGAAAVLYQRQRRKAEVRIQELNATLERQVRERTGRIESYSTLQRAILAHASYAIIAADIDGRITLFNPAAERLLGYAPAEALGGSPGMWHEPAELIAHAQALTLELGHHVEPGFDAFVAHAKLGLPDEKEWTYIRKDGSRCPVMLSISAIRGDDGAITGFLGIASDISARKQTEDRLRAATLAADAANRAKSEFLANMSHEIRSPMNAVLGMLMLLKQTALDARQLDYAAKAEAAGRALLGILNDILDFSRVEAGKMTLDPQPFSLDKLLRDVAVILAANVGERDVEVLYEIDPALPAWAVGDSMRLQQVLINLAGNAIKFTPQGEVVVSVRQLPADAEHPETLWLGFAIRDTGIGISAEQRQRIFDGFSQAEASTARRFGGSGLGLAISQRLVRLMGGALTVDSVVGQGSTFRFSVACAAAPVDALPLLEQVRPGALVEAQRLNGLHCLVVDDHDTARELLAGMLETFGWQVEVAGGGEQALELVRGRSRTGRAYDVVFLDWRMPGMDGWEVGERIAALLPPERLPLMLMVTAHGREILDERGADDFRRALDGFLVKPVTASMLFDAVADATAVRALARRRTAVPEVAAAAAPHRPRLQGLRLLLVEDNLINQQVARELLSYQGAAVTVAEDGRVAIEAVRTATPPFDCVLMDIQMPEMDGYEATRLIRGELGMTELPIIAMTANAMVSDRDAALAAGMNDHVGKPFDLDELIEAIQRQTAAAPAA
jgi:PAS domain S-box-containing protein